MTGPEPEEPVLPDTTSDERGSGTDDVGDPDDLFEDARLFIRGRIVARGHGCDGDLTSQLPVHRTATRQQDPLQLAEERSVLEALGNHPAERVLRLVHRVIVSALGGSGRGGR